MSRRERQTQGPLQALAACCCLASCAPGPHASTAGRPDAATLDTAQPVADTLQPADAAGKDAAPAAADDGAKPDAAADVPLAADPTHLAYPGACLPAQPTAETIGAATLPPAVCPATPCATCAAPFACTCAGDGGTPCAWAPMAPLKWARARAAGVVGDDGRLYVFGGVTGMVAGAIAVTDDPLVQGISRNGEIFDPSTNTWTLMATAPIYPSPDPAIAWGDGHLYVAGSNQDLPPWMFGLVDNPPYARYDPKTDTWTALPTVGSPGGCGTRDSLHWLNGKLVALGALWAQSKSPNGNAPGPPAVYDPSSGTWTSLPAMPPPGTAILTRGFRAAVLGTRLIWVQNVDDKASVGVILDGTAWTWSLFDPPSCAPQLIIRSTAATQGWIAMWGSAGPGTFDHQMWLWRPDPPQWTAVPVPLWLEDQRDRTLLGTAGGEFVVAGSQPLMSAGIYSPATGTWRRLATAGGPNPNQHSEMVRLTAGQLLLVGGAFNVPMPQATALTSRVLVPDL